MPFATDGKGNEIRVAGFGYCASYPLPHYGHESDDAQRASTEVRCACGEARPGWPASWAGRRCYGCEEETDADR